MLTLVQRNTIWKMTCEGLGPFFCIVSQIRVQTIEVFSNLREKALDNPEDFIEVLSEELVDTQVPEGVDIVFHFSPAAVIYGVAKGEQTRRQNDEGGDAFLPESRVPCYGSKHLGCALRMANIGHFLLTRHLLDVVEEGGRVEIAHLLEAELPECLV